MTIVSTTVGLTDTAEGTDYNNLRADVLQNHTHDGTDGTTVDHGDLTHPDSYAIVNEHEDVDGHIAAVKNVHGKQTTIGDEFIAGAVGGDFAIIPFTYSFLQSIGDSGEVETIDFSSIVTMASTDYFVFMSFSDEYSKVAWSIQSRTTTDFKLEIFIAHGGNDISVGHTCQVLIIGVPARP